MLVYFITCFKSARFTQELLSLLDVDANLVIIHCDPKSPRDLKAYVDALCVSHSNIVQLRPRPYSWAGFSQVRATLDALGIALRLDRPWTHFIPLSEDHLPLFPAAEIFDRLVENTSIVSFQEYGKMIEASKRDVLGRLQSKFVEVPGLGAFGVTVREVPEAFLDELAHGSNWMVLAHDAANLVYRADQESYFASFADTLHADETAIQSLIRKLSNGSLVNLNRESTFVAWPHLSGNPHMVMTEENFWAARTSGHLFIRKRPDSLPDGILGAIGRRSENQLPFLAPAIHLSDSDQEDEFVEARREYIESFLKTQLDRFNNLVFESVHSSASSINVPKFYLNLYSADFPKNNHVAVLSQDLKTFKICIVEQSPFEGEFAPELRGDGELVILLRVRVHNLFFRRELFLEELGGDGVLAYSDDASLNNLVCACGAAAGCLLKRKSGSLDAATFK